jgi:hypothetical protein
MHRATWTLSMTMAAALAGCGGGGTNTEEGGSTTDPSGATEAATEPTGGPTGGTTDTPTTGGDDTSTGGADTEVDGGACQANGDCMSVACEKYRDVEQGTCVAGPGGGLTRATGTLLDFSTGMPIASTELRVVGAVGAVSDPLNAAAVIQGMSGADGKFDLTSADPIAEAFGIVGIVSGGAYYTTATGMASPGAMNKFGPMTSIRDVWGVPSASLDAWTALLMTDPDFAPPPDPDDAVLPLGPAGGVIGLVRDGATGTPKAGEKVISMKADSTAVIRYLAADGMSFTSDVTSDNGIFVLVKPGFAEVFTVESDMTLSGTAGSAKSAVFVLVFNL